MENYFSAQKNEAMNSKLNANGWDADMGFSGQQQLNAEGSEREINKSQPYIIRIANTTTVDVTDAVLLNASLAQFSPAQSGLSKTYRIGGLTYQQFLAQLASGMVFEVGEMLLKASHASSTSLPQDQVVVTCAVETIDPNGTKFSATIVPIIDIYQQQTNATISRVPFFVNGLTKLTFDTIYASTTLDIYLYPYKKVNQFAQLDQSAVTSYSRPSTAPALGK